MADARHRRRRRVLTTPDPTPPRPTPPPAMDPALRQAAVAARGFMPTDEGDALCGRRRAAGRAVPAGPLLEIGSYCGKSTI